MKGVIVAPSSKTSHEEVEVETLDAPYANLGVARVEFGSAGVLYLQRESAEELHRKLGDLLASLPAEGDVALEATA